VLVVSVDVTCTNNAVAAACCGATPYCGCFVYSSSSTNALNISSIPLMGRNPNSGNLEIL